MKKTEKIELLNPFAEWLKETFGELEETQAELARKTGIPSPHLSEMKGGRRRCTPENDLRLSAYFGFKPGFFLRMQTNHEIEKINRDLGDVIRAEVVPA